MNIRLRFITLASAILLLGVTSKANAVCLDPNNLDKYLYPTLEQEIETSAAIVIGTIIEIEILAEDPTDPDGWTASIYKVRVTEVIRGPVAKVITLRAGNDSGGYKAESGTSHVLFLYDWGEYYSVDPCGNSAEMPGGAAVVDEIKAALSE